jgi:predicted acyl esterase
VILWVATSAVDTDFTVKLIDVYPPSAWYPQGYALNLGRIELELPAVRREPQHGGGDRARWLPQRPN